MYNLNRLTIIIYLPYRRRIHYQGDLSQGKHPIHQFNHFETTN